MNQQLELRLSPEEAGNISSIRTAVAHRLGTPNDASLAVRIRRKSIDARGRVIHVNLLLDVWVNEQPPTSCYENEYHYGNVSNGQPVVIVGSGPAGLFCALRLIEYGFKPILLERGKEVLERKKDIALQNRNAAFNEESNYCFGEGGAGTFSDGKLYTRSNKRGNIRRVLEIFHQHGAQDSILYESHPHIGTDRLPDVIRSMKRQIIDCGGEVHFGAKVTDLLIEDGIAKGVQLLSGDTIRGVAVVLATGHSARDIYAMLCSKGITVEPKGFAMGVRVEHPQPLIDAIQYHRKRRGDYLPAASYNVVDQVANRGVYSFCMCPGGYIVPASTERDGVVVNGMSSSARNSQWANSGIVVEIRPEDLAHYHQYGPLCGLEFQKQVEQMAKANSETDLQSAPAQRLTDFVEGKLSSDLPACSYIPGIESSPMHSWLPAIVGDRLREGFKRFDKKMHGYLTREAVVVGVESRSSSPLRIPRDSESREHIQIKNLYPCGEGSGYAGGITSSAMDGEIVAEKIAERYGAKA